MRLGLIALLHAVSAENMEDINGGLMWIGAFHDTGRQLSWLFVWRLFGEAL